MALLLNSKIRVSLLHLELYGLNKRKGRNALPLLFTHEKGGKTNSFTPKQKNKFDQTK